MLTIVWAFTCHCLFAVGGSGLGIWWLLTNQGGYCWRSGQLWQFLKIGQEQGLPHRLTLPAWTTSLQPTRYLAALDQIVENFFQNWSQSFQTVPLLYHLSLCNILSPLLLFQQTSQHFHQQTSQLLSQDSTSWLFHKKWLIHSSFIERGSNYFPSSGSTSNSSSLAVHHICSYFIYWSLETPWSHLWGLNSTSSKFLLMLISWPLPVNHEFSSWQWQWWIIPRGFQLTLPRSIRGTPVYGNCVASQNVFIK